jgi:hypothetical protein
MPHYMFDQTSLAKEEHEMSSEFLVETEHARGNECSRCGAHFANIIEREFSRECNLSSCTSAGRDNELVVFEELADETWKWK